jgi:hypothetical protein
LLAGQPACFALEPLCFIFQPDPAQFYDHLRELGSRRIIVRIGLLGGLWIHGYLPGALIGLALLIDARSNGEDFLLARLALSHAQ